MAALRLGQHHTGPSTLLIVAGIFAGSMVWWIMLATGVNHFRKRFNDRSMCWLNRIGGMAIGGFGIATIVFALAR